MNYNSILFVQLIEDCSRYDYTDKGICANDVTGTKPYAKNNNFLFNYSCFNCFLIDFVMFGTSDVICITYRLVLISVGKILPTTNKS